MISLTSDFPFSSKKWVGALIWARVVLSRTDSVTIQELLQITGLRTSVHTCNDDTDPSGISRVPEELYLSPSSQNSYSCFFLIATTSNDRVVSARSVNWEVILTFTPAASHLSSSRPRNSSLLQKNGGDQYEAE